jgi:hypothetical protein
MSFVASGLLLFFPFFFADFFFAFGGEYSDGI